MAVVFDRLLANPGDPALNIRYAELAEADGDIRKALAAYERVLASDPDNPQVRRAYYRIKRKLQPAVTAWTLDAGVTYATNPRQVPSSSPLRESDVTYDIALLMFDERTVAGHRWRTNAVGQTQIQNDISDLTDGRVFLATGPVIDLSPRSRLHIAPGASAAWLDGDWLYYDALVKVTFETLRGGATQWITATYAQRETNDAFDGSDGAIFEVLGKYSFYNKLVEGDVLYAMPRFRYSEASGAGDGRVFSRPLFPGNFIEYGARVAYFAPVVPRKLFLGAGLGAYYRDYGQTVAFSSKKREDWLLEPTAHLVMPQVRGSKFDIRVDYRYEHNDSNDPTEEFENHVVGVRTVKRF